MKLKLVLPLALVFSILCCNKNKPIQGEIAGEGTRSSTVRFYVDSTTNSEDPEKRMAYGLNIVPPWSDGGSIFVNLPEHLEYMPETMGIARHHDKRANVWKVSADSAEASYDVESLTEPGVFFAVRAAAVKDRATFEVTIGNRSKKVLRSIRPLFCFQYDLLKGFPAKLSDNFQHTYIVINEKLVKVSGLTVEKPDAYARMAQAKDCSDEHNWWAKEMGGFISEKMDSAVTILTSSNDQRKVILRWLPGKNFLSNSFIPCIHADPCIGDLEPGQTRTVKGELIFTHPLLDETTAEHYAL
ncbi:MAG: hypothetical protein WD824_04370 [Cyclobacteriaceae bacterium]